jgi:hypothetical protein
VPTHIFLCLLAYHVEWHLRRAWAPLLFEDEERAAERKRRDPILPTSMTETSAFFAHVPPTLRAQPSFPSPTV